MEEDFIREPWVPVTTENVDEIKPEDVVFYSRPGRMGDMFEYRVGMTDGRLFITNTYEKETNAAHEKLFLRLFAKFPKGDKCWEERYIGFGMCLVVRQDLKRTHPLSSLLRAFWEPRKKRIIDDEEGSWHWKQIPGLVNGLDGLLAFCSVFSHLYMNLAGKDE